jgi:hypothetical protein
VRLGLAQNAILRLMVMQSDLCLRAYLGTRVWKSGVFLDAEYLLLHQSGDCLPAKVIGRLLYLQSGFFPSPLKPHTMGFFSPPSESSALQEGWNPRLHHERTTFRSQRVLMDINIDHLQRRYHAIYSRYVETMALLICQVVRFDLRSN